MNYPIISRLLSYILGAMALAFLFCAGVALLYADGERTLHGFLLSAGIAFFLAGLLFFLSRGASSRIFRKEALCVIGVGWIVASAIGALPYIAIMEETSLPDAIFESVSGITTTGASVYTGYEEMPRALLFWRCLSQWIGGIGILVFFVAILGYLGAGGKIIFTHESSAKSADLEQGRVQSGVKVIAYIYLVISLLCALSLRFAGMSWYDAVCHTFTTVATGGFSTRTASVAAFESPLIEWTMILFMILGSTSFLFMLQIVQRNWTQVRNSTEVAAYYLLLAAATALVAFSLFAWRGADAELHHTVRAAAFQVVSIGSTSGFATEDFNAWPVFTHTALLALMIIGGCSASTAGGMKVIRFVAGIRICLYSIERSFRPHVVRPVIINNRPVDPPYQESILIYITLLGLILLLAIPLFGLLEPNFGLEGSVSAVISTFFCIGPGFAEVGPAQNFGMISSPGKLFLCLLMIMGRIELFAVLVLFSPALWKKFS